MRTVDVGKLVTATRNGQHRAAGRLISLVENASPQLREVAAALAPYTGHAQVIGLTGAPGVGKSTCTSALITALRRQGKRVGALAIDPSSPFTGGALLGDRVRMQDHATDSEVFIRSMATRGHQGGLAWSTPQALRVYDAAGCDVVLLETVGVGQSELEVASLASTTLVLLAPGMGDGIQAAKAGLLEVADAFVVNKADRDGADQTERDLKEMLPLGPREHDKPSWQPPIVRTVATQNDRTDQVLQAIKSHHQWMGLHSEQELRRRRRAAAEIEAIALERLRSELGDMQGGDNLTVLAKHVADGALDPYSASDALVSGLRTKASSDQHESTATAD